MMNWLIGGIVVLALIAGGAFVVNQDQEVMKNEDAMEKDAMMQKDNAMEKEAMQKEDAMMKDDGMMQKEEGAMMEKGSYEPYAAAKLAKANDGDVVLFFRASWCPTCKVLDSSIRANAEKLPAGVTILDVNYDTETALKQKYGVTYQHTLVQVDAAGNLITKWSGGQTLESILAKVQ